MRSLHCDIFPVTLIFIDNETEFDRIMRKAQGSADMLAEARCFPTPGCAHTIALSGNGIGLVTLVTLGDFSEVPEEDIESILTHEAVHVWQFLKEAIGEDTPGCETEAYAIQYFARYLIQEFHYRQDKRAKATANEK